MNPRKLPITLGLVMLIIMGSIYSCIKREIPIPPPIPTVNDTLNLKSGLLLYLPFNGTMADSSGNNNTTTVSGGATLGTDEHGNANSAFSSDGTGQFLFVTNNGSIKFDTTFSLSLNVMVNVQQQQIYVSMLDYSTGYGPSWNIGTSLPSIYAVDGGVGDSTESCDNYGDVSPTSKRIVDTSSFQPQAATWYNMIEVYQHGALKIYVNGQLVVSKVGTGSAALLCPSSQVVVGGWWSGDPENINGKIDEVRLYNRVLTPQEIAQLAKNL
jgi:Concanavalin A-like lectin/glucanases superfamily